MSCLPTPPRRAAPERGSDPVSPDPISSPYRFCEPTMKSSKVAPSLHGGLNRCAHQSRPTTLESQSAQAFDEAKPQVDGAPDVRLMASEATSLARRRSAGQVGPPAQRSELWPPHSARSRRLAGTGPTHDSFHDVRHCHRSTPPSVLTGPPALARRRDGGLERDRSSPP